MAITTYAELQTAIGNWLTRTSDLNSRIPEFIVLFEAWANRRLRVRQMEASTNLTPADGAATLPTDYLEYRRVTWTGNPRRELKYVSPGELQRQFPSTPASLPVFFTIEGSTLKIRPTNTTQIEFAYYQKIPALSAGNQATHWLFQAHVDLYLYGSLYASTGLIKDVEKLALWKQVRDEIAEEIDRLYKSGTTARGGRTSSAVPVV